MMSRTARTRHAISEGAVHGGGPYPGPARGHPGCPARVTDASVMSLSFMCGAPFHATSPIESSLYSANGQNIVIEPRWAEATVIRTIAY